MSQLNRPNHVLVRNVIVRAVFFPVILDAHRFTVNVSHDSSFLAAVLLVKADQRTAKVSLNNSRNNKDGCEPGQRPDRG